MDSLYTPLDPARKEIRLLEIITVDPVIQCRLQTAALVDKPCFDALSYTWGDAGITESILVHDRTVRVTINLARALRSAYHQHISIGSVASGKTFRIWADAVCINQSDDAEKGFQIPLMWDIYTSAAVVYVWLASSAETLRRSFSTIEILASAGAECSRLAETEVPTFLNTWATRADTLALTRALEAFFQDEYWERVWTFQEVVLGQDICFVGGHQSAPFEALASAGAFLRLYMDTSRAYSEDSRSSASMWLAIRRLIEPMSIVYSIVEMKEMVTERRQRQLNKQPDEKLAFEDMALLGFQLSQCCALSSRRRATNPKDYIYGFSALLSLKLHHDYSPNTSVTRINCDLVKMALDVGGSMCLELLDTAGIGHAWELPAGHPSWAPNFASVADAASRGNRESLIRANWVSFVAIPNETRPVMDLAQGSLTCMATRIDSFAELGPCFDHGKPDSGWMQWLFEVLVEDYSSGALGKSKLCSLIDGILKATVTTADLRPPSLNIGIANTDYDMHNTLVLVFCLEQICEARSPTVDESAFSQALLPESNSSGRQTTLQKYELLRRGEASFITQLIDGWSEVCGGVTGLRIARTSSRLFGIFPPGVQQDDVIVMINACSNPAVLRKTSNHYAFVGWCHVTEYNGRPAGELVADGSGVLDQYEMR